MRRLDLQEHTRSGPEPLSSLEREALRGIASLTIEPAPGDDRWYLTPGSTIGALELGDLSVSIRPKLEISRVLYLASYAMGEVGFREERFRFEKADTLVETLIPAFVSAARRAFSRGLLHGYRTEEEALHTVRGRIVVAEQVRRRFGVPFPVEVRYDEFTDDILANQLVKAAVALLGRMRIRDSRARAGLGWTGAMLGNVSLVEFAPKEVPEVQFDRLNEHYREVVEISRLILRHWIFETSRGGLRAAGFLMDMNAVFQEFVTRALRDELGLSEEILRSDNRIREITLDEDGHIRLRPDLSWWEGSTCTFVGDAKYKNITGEREIPNADLYQLLAYATALDLPGGLLVYAKGEAGPAQYRVRHSGKRLEVVALDLSGEIDQLLASVADLARRVRRLRDKAGRPARAA